MQKGAFWRAPNFIYRLDFVFGFPVYDKVVVKLVEWFQVSDKDHPLSQELFLGYAPNIFLYGLLNVEHSVTDRYKIVSWRNMFYLTSFQRSKRIRFLQVLTEYVLFNFARLQW